MNNVLVTFNCSIQSISKVTTDLERALGLSSDKTCSIKTKYFETSIKLLFKEVPSQPELSEGIVFLNYTNEFSKLKLENLEAFEFRLFVDLTAHNRLPESMVSWLIQNNFEILEEVENKNKESKKVVEGGKTLEEHGEWLSGSIRKIKEARENLKDLPLDERHEMAAKIALDLEKELMLYDSN